MLSSYACDPNLSKGRLYPEKKTPYRNEYERDRDRIIHSSAFRRLQHKTQVFVNHEGEGDHHRTRLTHSIEVSSIARSLCKTLNLCEDLAESVGLAHDLGHTPFGHAGEEALDSCMKEFGGFSHNAHSLKILTKIEKKYAAYDGLNLTWEVIEGIVKHNGPIISDESGNENISAYILAYDKRYSLALNEYSSAEAQVAALSDDVAYICHDIEDSIRCKIISFDDLAELEFIDRYIREITLQYPNLTPSSSQSRIIYEVVRSLVHYLIDSLLFQTKENLRKQKIQTCSDIRNLGYQLVDFTPKILEEIGQIKNFLFRKVYKHPEVTSVTLKCQKIIRGLFKLYMDNHTLLPGAWQLLIGNDNIGNVGNNVGNEVKFSSKADVIADYIAGMTDRFAIKEYCLLNNLHFNEI